MTVDFQVIGVDHASGMIEFAKKEKKNRALTNVEFVHADATNLSMFQDQTFDYAVLSFTIHEMPPLIRIPVLREAARISKVIIIIDYMIPVPINRVGVISLHFETLAGYNHLRNFLHFRDNGGLDALFNKVGLTIEEETKTHQGTTRIVKTKQTKN